MSYFVRGKRLETNEKYSTTEMGVLDHSYQIIIRLHFIMFINDTLGEGPPACSRERRAKPSYPTDRTVQKEAENHYCFIPFRLKGENLYRNQFIKLLTLASTIERGEKLTKHNDCNLGEEERDLDDALLVNINLLRNSTKKNVK